MIELSRNSSTLPEYKVFEILGCFPFSLPKIFLDFYRDNNGGVPDHSQVADEKHVFPVHEFYDWSDIQFFKADLDQYSVPSDLDHVKTLPFACDQGGNTYALYFDNKEPKVYFYTTSDEMAIHGEWPSFADFLSSFVRES